jgi:hypothetical protein
MKPTKGSILSALVWMIGLSLVLGWCLPTIGPFIAGYVGGRKAGNVGRALGACLLPTVAVIVLTVVTGGLCLTLPVVGGICAGLLTGSLAVAVLINSVGLWIGAIIGGALA